MSNKDLYKSSNDAVFTREDFSTEEQICEKDEVIYESSNGAVLTKKDFLTEEESRGISKVKRYGSRKQPALKSLVDYDESLMPLKLEKHDELLVGQFDKDYSDTWVEEEKVIDSVEHIVFSDAKEDHSEFVGSHPERNEEDDDILNRDISLLDDENRKSYTKPHIDEEEHVTFNQEIIETIYDGTTSKDVQRNDAKEEAKKEIENIEDVIIELISRIWNYAKDHKFTTSFVLGITAISIIGSTHGAYKINKNAKAKHIDAIKAYYQNELSKKRDSVDNIRVRNYPMELSEKELEKTANDYGYTSKEELLAINDGKYFTYQTSDGTIKYYFRNGILPNYNDFNEVAKEAYQKALNS